MGNEASQRLAEAEKAQAQANEVIAEINASIEKDKASFEQSLKEGMERSLAAQQKASEGTLKDMELEAASRVETYIQQEAITRGVAELKQLSGSQKSKFMDIALDSI